MPAYLSEVRIVCRKLVELRDDGVVAQGLELVVRKRGTPAAGDHQAEQARPSQEHTPLSGRGRPSSCPGLLSPSLSFRFLPPASAAGNARNSGDAWGATSHGEPKWFQVWLLLAAGQAYCYTCRRQSSPHPLAHLELSLSLSGYSMPPPAAFKISSSNHKLYHEALWLASLYVYVSLAYGTLLVGAALRLAGVPVGLLLGLQDTPLEKPHEEGSSAGVEGWVRTGALSLGTAGIAGLLIGALVSSSPENKGSRFVLLL